MSNILTIDQRNAVLISMAKLVKANKQSILDANKIDIATFAGKDIAMYDRLIVNEEKIQGMVDSLKHLATQEDPVGKELFHFTHENGLEIYNKTASFGTVMIIYESRPDVTIEAGGIAFKSGNKILLKGGKEAINSNLVLVDLWHKALTENNVSKDWIVYLNYNREETRAFLKNPTPKTDLIIPRGGERLIALVKKHATCPIIISGRGNNFVFVHRNADLKKAVDIIVNAKVAKISACNAIDKVLIDTNLEDFDAFLNDLIHALQKQGVEILGDEFLSKSKNIALIEDDKIWMEEFLDYKMAIGVVNNSQEAVERINTCSGGHSAVIITENKELAMNFMQNVDSAAVYVNASSRFTDGFEFGLGGELAISTDKLHQRGPIGLQHLVSNKWYIFGNGQIR